MFTYPQDIRKAIYTTNVIESLNFTLRKAVKTKGSFPNEDAAFKILYLALRNVEKKWTMPKSLQQGVSCRYT
jgi:putative transposase